MKVIHLGEGVAAVLYAKTTAYLQALFVRFILLII